MILIALWFAARPFVISPSKSDAGFARFPLLVVIIVIGFAVALYAAIGRPGVKSHVATTGNARAISNQQTVAATQDKAASVSALLTGLEERLRSNPGDGKDWLLLAKSYEHLGRDEDAAEAYAKAAELGITDESLAARLGDNTAAADAAIEIRGHLSYAQSIADQIGPDDVVFITAKAPGNPMPLAVLRRSASEMPLDFVLSDTTSMVKGSGIDSAGEVIVTAKVSKSGDALNTVSDLQAVAGPVEPGNAVALQLVIGAAAKNTKTE